MILAQVFWVFFKINLLAFGGVFGVLPELERMVVGEHAWLTHERFIQSYVVSQFVPGPNMAMCPLIGYWVAGWGGWMAGFVGIYSASWFVMASTFAVYTRHRGKAWVQHLERGFRPAITGLMTASAGVLWWSQSAGISPEAGRVLPHVVALALLLVGTWAYRRGRIGPLTLTFAMGAAWWAVNRFLLA